MMGVFRLAGRRIWGVIVGVEVVMMMFDDCADAQEFLLCCDIKVLNERVAEMNYV